MRWDRESSGVLEMPSGRRIRGRRLSVALPPDPEWGLYLGVRDPGPPWPHRWVLWPDFGLPLDDAGAWDALGEAWRRSEYERVEIACRGGQGRTGTALAALAVLEGLDVDSAVTLVRNRYHHRAVETPWQRRWLARRTWHERGIPE